jgi:hypothetical protein
VSYTHYWSYRPASAAYRAAWPQILRDATRIVEHVGKTVNIAGPDGTGAPLLNHTGIAFTGAFPDDEYFELVPPDDGGQVWAHCTTAPQGCDVAVTAILLRCHLLLPAEFRINSNGRFDSDWLPARHLVRQLFRITSATIPFTSTAAGIPLPDSPQGVIR